MPNPTMRAINAYYAKLRQEFIKTSIRTPRKEPNYSCFSSLAYLCDPPRYTGRIKKVGDQRSIIEYMKDKGMY